MDSRVPGVGRLTFFLHALVAVAVGLYLLADPIGFGAGFGYPVLPESQPVLRSFGAMVLAFGGLTSIYGMRAPTWQHVDYIVRGELAYLAVQAVVFGVSALVRVGPALANWVFAGLSSVLFVLFAATFVARPR